MIMGSAFPLHENCLRQPSRVLPCSGRSVWMPVLRSWPEWEISPEPFPTITQWATLSAQRQPGVRLAVNGDNDKVCLAQRCAETLLWMEFGMRAFQGLQIDMIDIFFFFLWSFISGKKKKEPTPLISVDSPLHRNSRRDNQGLCDIIAEGWLFLRAELKWGRVFIAKCSTYQPLTVINSLAIK